MNPQRYSLILLLLVSLDVRGSEPRGGPIGIFRTDVPAERFNLILGRPTRSSAAVSVLTSTDTEGFIRYGAESDPCTNRTETVGFKAGESRVVPLDGLRADTGYGVGAVRAGVRMAGVMVAWWAWGRWRRPPAGKSA